MTASATSTGCQHRWVTSQITNKTWYVLLLIYLGFYIFKVVKSKGPWLRYVLGHDASYSKQSIQSDVYQSVEGS